MSSPQEQPVDFLQQLADVGLLTLTVEQPSESFQFSCLQAAIPDLKIGVGELLPSQPKRVPIPILYKPHSTPTLFWKALAATLAPFLSNATNLSDEEQAIFLATPTQTGIPGGDLAPAEVVNFQVFQKADALQILNRPALSLDQGSYFAELNKFMRNLVSDDDSLHIDAARQSLLKATEAKNAAWNNALARYEARIDDEFKTPTFQDFIKDDEDYKRTWQQELDAQRRYVGLQGGDMEAISQQISILKLADNRIDFKNLIHMPCSALSEDFVRRAYFDNVPRIKVDPSTIFYRPIHTLANWETICNDWAVEKTKTYSYSIDFDGLPGVTWAELGHEGLDAVESPKLKNDQQALVDQLQGKIIFYGKPKVLDVERGMWDVKQLRQAGNLSPYAPETVRHKFCKTTKLLLSWGYDIELTLPESIGTTPAKQANLTFLKLPLADRSPNERVLKFSTEPTNYPWLVAVLATVI